METYKSSTLPSRARVAAWNELYCARLDRAELTPLDRERFDAEMQLGALGPLRLARLSCSGGAIDRTSAHVDAGDARTYTVIVQTRGTGTLSQYGHEALLMEGDIALCDNAAPHSHVVGERSELMMLRVPAPVLRQHLPSPEHFCGRRLPANEGMTPMVCSLVGKLNPQVESRLPVTVQERLAHQLLEMLATSYSLVFDATPAPSTVVGGRLAKAKQFIEQQLRDPDLGPGQIAGSLQVSSRYLRMIFAGARESVSSYILRRRLEESARQLSDPRWRARSICEIAFGWGFNSAPHFSRSFRDRYGLSPRQYRARHMGPHGDAGFRAVAP